MSEGVKAASGDNRRRNNNKRGRGGGGGGRGKGRRGRGGNKADKEAISETVAELSADSEDKATAKSSAAKLKQDGRGRRAQGGNKDKGGSTVVESAVADEPMSAASSTAPPKEDAIILEPLPADSSDSWFVASLKNLGHFDPSSVKSAMEVQQDPNSADSQLVSLTLWMEDSLIRSWKVDERRKLRDDFWAHINNYLDGLECPIDYFPDFYFADEDKMPHWRYSSSHRQKVVCWLISNATSEAFGDIASQQTADSSPIAPVADETNEVESGESKEAEGSSQENPFPLGFSTGDDKVDHIVSLLRMKLLIQLEEDQKAVNEAVCQVQSVTSGKARPLKQAKLRPNNIKKPPPERRGGRGRGGGGRGRGRRR